jgi:hypothetical protein
MQTIQQVTAGLLTNLSDPRMHSICLYINDLITRQAPEVTVSTHRVWNTTTNVAVQNFEQFRSAIVAQSMLQAHPYQGEKISNDRVMGYTLVPTNLEVRFNIHSEEDLRFSQHQNYFADFNSTYRFSFLMAYMNDADQAVPLKISSVRLIHAG